MIIPFVKGLLMSILLFISCSLIAQNSLNVSLFGQIDRGDARYSGSWAYTSPGGEEYALLGTTAGTVAYHIESPDHLPERGFIPGPTSNWREITVMGQHAYVTTEGSGTGSGMQVIDLQYLPDSLHLLTTYDETFTRGHIIQRDIYSDSQYVYINGTTTTEGIHILDVSDPAKPLQVGLYQPGYYIHDCHVNGDYLYAAAFFEGKIDVVNISDKTNPILEWEFMDPNGRTHSSWLTEDRSHLFLCSEADGLKAQVFNIETPQETHRVATYTANDSTLVHNPYIRGDFAFISHNSEGLRVVDISDPTLPVEVGFYDTYAQASGGSSGLWSACPYLPSGKIIGGDRGNGLYVWTFNDTKASRVYGLVRDSISGMTLQGAEIVLVEKTDTLQSDLSGTFKMGMLAGDYTLQVKLLDYHSKEIRLFLSEGESKEIIIDLVPDDFVSGVNTIELFTFKIHPNPAKEFCFIDLESIPNVDQIQVFDALGQRVTLVNGVGGKQELQLDISNFEAGLYFVEARNSKGHLLGQERLIIP